MSLKSVDLEIIINRMFIEVGQAVKKSKEVQLKICRERTILFWELNETKSYSILLLSC